MSESLLVAIFVSFICLFSSILAQQPNPPHGCTGSGYCYPTNRTTAPNGDISCDASCVCPSTTTQTSPTTCQYAATCTASTCASSQYDCSMVNGQPVCACKPGFTGPTCTMPLSDPCADTPCLNRGTCSANGTQYQCSCDSGCYGPQCQYDSAPCPTLVCQNGGTCTIVNDGNSAICTCTSGYYAVDCGTTASIETDYVSCYTDSSYTYPASYIVYTGGTITKSPDCLNALLAYRAINPNSPYIYSTFSGTTGKCYFSASNDQPSGSQIQPCGLLGLGCLFGDTCKTTNPGNGKSSVYVVTAPCLSDPCGNANDWGVCVQSSETGYTCVCQPDRTGAQCQTAVTPAPCSAAGVTCGAGTCEVTDDTYGYYCLCNNGTKQIEPCATDYCTPNPCLDGGTCTSNSTGYSCACYNLYIGTNCEIFDACYINQCQNGGTCTNIPNALDSTFNCTCVPGFRGVLCEIEIMPCDSEPCVNNGTCNNIIGPPKDYSCTCTVGWTSKNCSEDIDECVVYGPNLCTKKDPTATCTNCLHGVYICNCGQYWMGTNCTINKLVYDILNATYGYVNDDDLDQLSSQLASDPTVVRDLIPFLIGGYSDEERANLSWTYDDMFIWVAYEQKLIDVEQYLTQWNDKVLGNCFTFNYMNVTDPYLARYSGYSGGLELQTSLRQDEYLPWIETAAISVFIHSHTETVFAESPRTNSKGATESRIAVTPQRFKRLGGKYGRCINEVSEVKSYYYGGSYTTDGCLGSCYQDVVNAACSCMDPRYPMPSTATSCQLGKKSCIDNLTAIRGDDPSKYSECSCPSPCSNIQYEVEYTLATSTSVPLTCSNILNAANYSQCLTQQADMVMLKIGLPSLVMSTFAETPAMDLISFISQLGGLLGVVMGISIVTFIEFGWILLYCSYILVSFKKRR